MLVLFVLHLEDGIGVGLVDICLHVDRDGIRIVIGVGVDADKTRSCHIRGSAVSYLCQVMAHGEGSRKGLVEDGIQACIVAPFLEPEHHLQTVFAR